MTDTSLAHIIMSDFYEALDDLDEALKNLNAVVNEQLPITENMNTVMGDWLLTTDEKLSRMNEAEKYSVELRQASRKIQGQSAVIDVILIDMSKKVSGCDDL